MRKHVAAATAAGGTVVPKMPIPGLGYAAYLTDNEGNVFGMMPFDATV